MAAWDPYRPTLDPFTMAEALLTRLARSESEKRRMWEIERVVAGDRRCIEETAPQAVDPPEPIAPRT